MSEIQDPEKKPEKKNDRDFISEKIVRPAPSKKQIATKMATAACAGVIFGVVSAVCFALTRPILEQLSEGNRPTASAISIPKDEVESSVEAQETESAAETETEPVEEMVQTALEHYPLYSRRPEFAVKQPAGKSPDCGQKRGGGSFSSAEYRLV